MANPALSVVIPTYNRAAYLPSAVGSALEQVGVDTEVIVVDDGSTDDTAAVVAARAPRWGPRFRCLRQENAERGAARNQGLRHSRGEFVAFLDSDDVWRSDHAARCVRALEAHPEAVAAYSEYGVIDSEGRVIHEIVSRPPVRGDAFLQALCLKRLIIHPTEVVLRRAAVAGERLFDPDIPGAEDWLLWVRLACRAPLERVGEATVWMRLHAGGTFGAPEKLSESLMTAARRVIDTGLPARLEIPGPRILAINRIHGAYAYYLSGRRREAMQKLRVAVSEYPLAALDPGFLGVAARVCLGTRVGRWVRRWRQRPRRERVEGFGVVTRS